MSRVATPPETAQPVPDETTPQTRPFSGVIDVIIRSIGPVLLALLTGGIILLLMGRDPIEFVRNTLNAGLLTGSGLQNTINRMTPLLLIAAGLMVAFRANVWNLGIDGQFLMGAVMTAGLAPALAEALPLGLVFPILIVTAAITGALWTVIPAILKARYAVNEIITTIMMNFIGINLANYLVKNPFDDPNAQVPQTRVLPFDDRLSYIPGTRIHLGIVIAAIAIVVAHMVLTRTPFGMKLYVLGSNPKAARHAGLSVSRLTVIAFMLSGAIIAIGGAIEILGLWGVARADWNPGFGFFVVPLVFLARKNGYAIIAFVAFFAVISMGGELASRRASLPNDFQLVIVGLILLFMTITEYLGNKRDLGRTYLKPQPAPGKAEKELDS
jgi:ABC-type uncharacterized transport system permease subunit